MCIYIYLNTDTCFFSFMTEEGNDTFPLCSLSQRLEGSSSPIGAHVDANTSNGSSDQVASTFESHDKSTLSGTQPSDVSSKGTEEIKKMPETQPRRSPRTSPNHKKEKTTGN